MQKISVIMPIYNDEDHIAASLNNVQAALDALGFDHEVVLVGDGNREGTRREALCAARSPQEKVAGHESNVGKGYALKYRVAHTVGFRILGVAVFDQADLRRN